MGVGKAQTNIRTYLSCDFTIISFLKDLCKDINKKISLESEIDERIVCGGILFYIPIYYSDDVCGISIPRDCITSAIPAAALASS